MVIVFLLYAEKKLKVTDQKLPRMTQTKSGSRCQKRKALRMAKGLSPEINY